MARKALGRGLSALISEEPLKMASGDELLDIDIDLIRPNAAQPRKSFPDENLNELAQSIRSNGVVQPVIVMRLPGGYFQLIAGERRWRASQRAELKKIPAVVRDIDPDRLLEIALIENIQRQELNPIEEAQAYRNLIGQVGLTQEILAERVGKNRTVITNSMRLLKLPDEVQKLVAEEKISAGHARTLLMLEDPAAQKRLAKNIIEMSLSVRETEKAVKRVSKEGQGGEPKLKASPKTDANTKAAETKLRRHLATQVKITSDGKGISGKIEIEYFGQADLDRIYRLILGEK